MNTVSAPGNLSLSLAFPPTITPAQSNMRPREDILEDMARALTVTSVADGTDEGAFSDDNDPGPGGDWFDSVQGIDPNAREACRKLAADVEKLLGIPLPDLEVQWKEAARYRHDDFGYLLVMQSLGHGVGLSDEIYGDKPSWLLKLNYQDLLSFSFHDLCPTVWPFLDTFGSETND